MKPITFLLLGLWLVLAACTAPEASQTPPVKETLGETTPPSQEVTPQVEAAPTTIPGLISPPENPPAGASFEFTTDFSKHTVSYKEILSGGPEKDGIPAIDELKYVSVNEANPWLKPLEPVILVQVNEEARAYPIQILMWHEIVNDTLGGVPLTVTFCPLCNTAIVFERTFENQMLDFGTTGRLRFSNLIMYDRQTETWWQQASGEAIAGEFAGKRLSFYPAVILSWDTFRSQYPDGSVLSRETGYARSYGRNPYAGYDDINQPPFLYQGPATPGTLLPMERVLTIETAMEATAYPYPILAAQGVVNDNVGGEAVVVFWASGTASPLDTQYTYDGRDIGAAAAFSRVVNQQTLSFLPQGSAGNGQFQDAETGSTWNLLGEAISGPLAGSQLTPVVSINHFWFSWAAFKPSTRVYTP